MQALKNQRRASNTNRIRPRTPSADITPILGYFRHGQSVTFSKGRDKPPKPFVKSPLMVHEALASIRVPLQVDRLSITNGHVTYCERLAVGADPGVLTIGAVSLSVEGVANRGEAAASVQLRGRVSS